MSYAGGWTLMEETDRQSTSALVHYSPTAFYSVGVKADWDRRSDILFTGAQATWLAKPCSNSAGAFRTISLSSTFNIASDQWRPLCVFFSLSLPPSRLQARLRRR